MKPSELKSGIASAEFSEASFDGVIYLAHPKEAPKLEGRDRPEITEGMAAVGYLAFTEHDPGLSGIRAPLESAFWAMLFEADEELGRALSERLHKAGMKWHRCKLAD